MKAREAGEDTIPEREKASNAERVQTYRTVRDRGNQVLILVPQCGRMLVLENSFAYVVGEREEARTTELFYSTDEHLEVPHHRHPQ